MVAAHERVATTVRSHFSDSVKVCFGSPRKLSKPGGSGRLSVAYNVSRRKARNVC
jgi:hypothetical protein